MATFSGHIYEAPVWFRKYRIDRARLYAASFAGGVDNDGVPPVVTVISPSPGTDLGQYVPVIIDVIDLSPGLVLSLLVVRFSSDRRRFVAWDGNSFVAPYDALSSTTSISNGLRFSLLPAGGWSPGITVQVDVYAIDQGGVLEGVLP